MILFSFDPVNSLNTLISSIITNITTSSMSYTLTSKAFLCSDDFHHTLNRVWCSIIVLSVLEITFESFLEVFL